MTKLGAAPSGPDLLLFDEQSPAGSAFRSECPPDKRIKIEDLFAFRRGRGDLVVSLAALAVFL